MSKKQRVQSTIPAARTPPDIGVENVLEILANAPIAMVVKDLAGRFVFMNPHAATLLGVEPGALLGQSADDVFGPEVAAHLSAHDREVLASGQAQEFEEVVSLPDGPHTVLSLKFPVHDDVGAMSGVAVIATDITERVRLSEELRESEQRLHYVLTQAPLYLSIADADGRLTFLSGSKVAEMGVDPASSLGHGFEEILRDSPVMVEQTRRALAGESVVGDVERFGRIFERHIAPVRDGAGQPEGVIGIAVDVTEHRLAERELASARDHLDYLITTAPVVIGESVLPADLVVYKRVLSAR